jgi:hypothetical protein
MPEEIGDKTYYTMEEFADEVGRKYGYIRKCARGLQRAKDLSSYVRRIGDKPFIDEEAKKEFGD